MTLHPQAQQFVEMIARQGAPSWDEMAPAEGRALFASLTELFGAAAAVAATENLQTDNGIALRLFRPALTPGLPVVIYFHGGGWVLGDLDTHDALCRRLALESGAVVIAVDYRLAPEHTFPAALDDCWDAVRFVAARAGDLQVDADRLAVAGDSAGGHLVAGVTKRARDEQGPAIRFQVLIYPVIAPDFDTESYRAFATGHGLTRQTMQWFWQQYVDAGAADARLATRLYEGCDRLPPTLVITAEYDVLRDEGEQYAQALKDAGVQVTLKRFPGMLHGFVHFRGVFDDGDTALQLIGQTLSQELG